MLSHLFLLSKLHSFLPLLADFFFFYSSQQLHLLFSPSLFHSSLQHESKSHKSTISASFLYLMAIISFIHFLLSSNTRLLPNSTHKHTGHSTCHYSWIFFLVIISVVSSSPTVLGLQLLALREVCKRIAVIWGLWQKLKRIGITGFVLGKSELPCELYYLASQLTFY